MVYVPEGREGLEFLMEPLGIMSDTRHLAPKPSPILLLVSRARKITVWSNSYTKVVSSVH